VVSNDAIIKAARWLDRAEEVKRMAVRLTHPGARLELLKIAETYRHMAESALLWTAPRSEGDGVAATGESGI
jgi:hypothetical protein